MEFGGDGIYSAWQLTYLEPAFRDKNFLGREKILETAGDYRYERGLYPVAERVQPRFLLSHHSRKIFFGTFYL